MARRIDLIGVPLDLGGGRRGVDMGPSALRVAGLGERLQQLGHRVRDLGDVPVPAPETRRATNPTKKYVKEIARACDDVLQRALHTLSTGGLPLVMGGDHSLGAGSVGASAAWARTRGGQMGLIWVDAHGDMNTPASSPSGNVHGMPLAALLGGEPSELARLGGFRPKIRPAHTVLLGTRNLDEREKALVRASGVHVFTMKDIDRDGMAHIAEEAVRLASAGTVGLHVSFDLDACDPSIAPGVGTPVRGGLDYREAHLFMEIVADSKRLTALDLVEINTALDVRNATAKLGMELALSALGMKIL